MENGLASGFPSSLKTQLLPSSAKCRHYIWAGLLCGGIGIEERIWFINQHFWSASQKLGFQLFRSDNSLFFFCVIHSHSCLNCANDLQFQVVVSMVFTVCTFIDIYTFIYCERRTPLTQCIGLGCKTDKSMTRIAVDLFPGNWSCCVLSASLVKLP